MQPDDNSCTLLVCSCDAYSDLWEPYFALLRLRWPDRPFPAALITENKRPSIPGVRPLTLGAGKDWSTLLIDALDELGSPYVLLTLEDFFLRSAVNTPRLRSLLADMKRDSLSMLRLTPRPGPTIKLAGKEYGGIAPGDAYKVSTQASFWKTETLRGLLMRGENAWQFELKGSARSEALGGFAAVWREALPYRHHVVERGKWFPWAHARFKRMRIGVDPTARGVMSLGETSEWIARKVISPVAGYLPPGLRRFLRSRRGQ